MISILFWIAFGATIGWVAAILQEEHVPRRLGAYIIAGAVGGLAGGFGGLLLGPDPHYQADTTSLMFAVFGATAFVFLAGFAAQHRSQQ